MTRANKRFFFFLRENKSIELKTEEYPEFSFMESCLRMRTIALQKQSMKE